MQFYLQFKIFIPIIGNPMRIQVIAIERQANNAMSAFYIMLEVLLQKLQRLPVTQKVTGSSPVILAKPFQGFPSFSKKSICSFYVPKCLIFYIKLF